MEKALRRARLGGYFKNGENEFLGIERGVC
jgi:hypothetical protein